MQQQPIDQFTQSQLDLAARNAPQWTLENMEQAEGRVVRRPARKPEPVVHSPWAHRAVWCALVLGALVALAVR